MSSAQISWKFTHHFFTYSAKTDGQTAVTTVPTPAVSVVISEHITIFFCFLCKVFILQVEPCDDTGGKDAYDILNNCYDVVADSDMPAVKQVNNFISDGCVLLWRIWEPAEICFFPQ